MQSSRNKFTSYPHALKEQTAYLRFNYQKLYLLSEFFFSKMDSESFHLVLAKERKQHCSCVAARYTMTALVFWGLFVVYVLRANLSVAIVAMVNNTAVAGANSNHSLRPFCSSVSDPTGNDSDKKVYDFEKDGEVVWDVGIQSMILGAFYYGYAVTQLPGGWISEKWGGKWPFGVGILLTSMFTLLTPIAARSSIAFAIITRVAKGLGEGVTYPAMYALFSRWAPLKERSLLIAIASVGGNLGTIVGMPVTALFCEHGFDNGWPSAFYICGIFGFIWFFPWALMASSRPTRHSTISDTELIHLKLNLGPLKKRPPTPWRMIFCSPAVWAVTIARFAGYWGLYTLITELPNYLHSVLDLDMDENGAVNAMVYTSQSLGMVAGGYLSDLLRTRTSLPITLNRKIFETIGCLGPALCLTAVPFAGCDRTLVVALVVIAQGLYGFNAGGSVPAMVDLAPDLAGTVSGIVLTVASIAGVLAPVVAGAFTKHGSSLDDWKFIFFITSAIYVFGAFVFFAFGSSEIQPWGHPVDVPTESRPKRPLLMYTPSASFSGCVGQQSEVQNSRSRFSTVAVPPKRRFLSEREDSTQEQ